MQLNASAFYYDHKDKQLRGAVLDPTFGPLEALVSIPESHVEGAETQLVARPIEGLTLDTSATYVVARIDRFRGFDARAWGRNVTSEYTRSNVFANANAIARSVGQPAIYGVSVSGRF